MTIYMESIEHQTDHFADAFVGENIAYDYDIVVIFKSLQLKPFCLEKSGVRKRIF